MDSCVLSFCSYWLEVQANLKHRQVLLCYAQQLPMALLHLVRLMRSRQTCAPREQQRNHKQRELVWELEVSENILQVLWRFSRNICQHSRAKWNPQENPLKNPPTLCKVWGSKWLRVREYKPSLCLMLANATLAAYSGIIGLMSSAAPSRFWTEPDQEGLWFNEWNTRGDTWRTFAPQQDKMTYLHMCFWITFPQMTSQLNTNLYWKIFPEYYTYSFAIQTITWKNCWHYFLATSHFNHID